jgi:hypothetical protein
MISKELSKEELLFPSHWSTTLTTRTPTSSSSSWWWWCAATTTRSLQPSARGGATHQGGHRVEEVAKED